MNFSTLAQNPDVITPEMFDSRYNAQLGTIERAQEIAGISAPAFDEAFPSTFDRQLLELIDSITLE